MVGGRVSRARCAVVLTAVRLVGAHGARFARARAGVVVVARLAHLCVRHTMKSGGDSTTNIMTDRKTDS